MFHLMCLLCMYYDCYNATIRNVWHEKNEIDDSAVISLDRFTGLGRPTWRPKPTCKASGFQPVSALEFQCLLQLFCSRKRFHDIQVTIPRSVQLGLQLPMSEVLSLANPAWRHTHLYHQMMTVCLYTFKRSFTCPLQCNHALRKGRPGQNWCHSHH